jgi:aromatic-L-amino-acid/L-tryptophan decarboxylase
MLPFGLGCLLVKDASCLKRLYSVLEEDETIEYIPNATNERFDFANCAPDSTKSAKGIRAWLPIKLFGMSAFKNCLDEKLDLTEFLLKEFKKIKEIEILSTCPLTVINFRYNNGENEKELDEKNKLIINYISKEQQVMVVNTTLNGIFSIRVCILHPRTSKSIIEMFLKLLKNAISNIE